MSGILDTKTGVTCPFCGSTVQVLLRDFKNGRVVHCPHGHIIKLNDQGRGLEKLDQATRKLERSLQQLKRRLR